MPNEPNKKTYLDDRQQKGLRFRPELLRRIDKLRKKRGWTFQTFMQMAAVKFADLLDAEDAKARTEEAATASSRTRVAGGLGIRDRIESSPSRRETVAIDLDDAPAAPAPVPVSVQVHVASATATATVDEEIQTLAREIILGAPHDRRRLTERACQKLMLRTASPAERVRLGELLDQEIKRIAPKQQSTLERVRARSRSRAQ